MERLEQLAQISLASRKRVCQFAQDFINDGQTILIHGYSQVVEEILLKAAESKRFKVIATESRPKDQGKIGQND